MIECQITEINEIKDECLIEHDEDENIESPYPTIEDINIIKDEMTRSLEKFLGELSEQNKLINEKMEISRELLDELEKTNELEKLIKISHDMENL